MSSLATALANIKASSPTSLSTSNSHRSSFRGQESVSRQSSFSSRQSSFGYAGVRGGNNSGICKFYRQGRCTRGSSCPFRHEESNIASSSGRKSQSVCKFYLKGNCQRGSLCAFRHEPNDDDISVISMGSGVRLQSSASRPVCKYFAKGYCSRGSSCDFLHQNTSTNSGRDPHALLQESSSSDHQTPSVPREKPTIEAIRARAAKAMATEACTLPLSSFLSKQTHNHDNVLSVGNQFEQVKISTVETPNAVTSSLTKAAASHNNISKQQTSSINSYSSANSIQTNSYSRTHSPLQSADLVHNDTTDGSAVGQVTDTDSILCYDIPVPKDNESDTLIFPKEKSSETFKIETSIPHAYENADTSLVDQKHPHFAFEHSPDKDNYANLDADKNVKTPPPVSPEEQLTPLHTSTTQLKVMTPEKETNLEDSCLLSRATTNGTIRASTFPNKLSSEQVTWQLQSGPSFLDSEASTLVNLQPQLNSDENQSEMSTPSPKAYIKQNVESHDVTLPSIAASYSSLSKSIANAKNDGSAVAPNQVSSEASSTPKVSSLANATLSLITPANENANATLSLTTPANTSRSSLSAASSKHKSDESSLNNASTDEQIEISSSAFSVGISCAPLNSNFKKKSDGPFVSVKFSYSSLAAKHESSDVSPNIKSSSPSKASESSSILPNATRTSLAAAASRYGSRELPRSKNSTQESTVSSSKPLLKAESNLGSSLSAAAWRAVSSEGPSNVKASSLSKACLSSATAPISRSSLSAAAASKYGSRELLSKEITKDSTVSSLKTFLKTEGSSLSGAASRAQSSEVSSKVKSSSLAKASLSAVISPNTSRSSLAAAASKGGHRELSHCKDSTQKSAGSSLKPSSKTEGLSASDISSGTVSSEVPSNINMSSLSKASLPKDSTNKSNLGSSFSLVKNHAKIESDSTEKAEPVIHQVSSLSKQTPITTFSDTFCLDNVTQPNKLPFQDQRDIDSSALEEKDPRPSSSTVSSEQELLLPSTVLTKSSLSAAESHRNATTSNTELTPIAEPSTLTPIVPSSLRNHSVSSSLSLQTGHDDLKWAAKLSSSSLLGLASEHTISSATSSFAKTSFAAGVCHSNSSSSLCQKETHLSVNGSLDANQEPQCSNTSAKAASSTSYLLAAKSSLSAASRDVNANTSASQEATTRTVTNCPESKTEHRGPNRAAQPSRNSSSLLAAASKLRSPYTSSLQKATNSSKCSHQTSSSEEVSAIAAVTHDWPAKHDAPLHSPSKVQSQREYRKANDKSPRSSASARTSNVDVSSAIGAWESKKAGSSINWDATKKASPHWRSSSMRSRSQKYAVPSATKTEECSIINSSSTNVNDSLPPKGKVTSLASAFNSRCTSQSQHPSLTSAKFEAPSPTCNNNPDNLLKALLGISETTLGERSDQKYKKETMKRWGDESDSDSD